MNDKEEMKIIVREAVSETFKKIGLDPDASQEMQADLIYLRKLRKGSEFINLRVKLQVIAILIPTILYLLWESVKNSVNK